MLSRPDNTVPNWQKVRAVHLNIKVGCVSYTNQCFLSPPQNRNQAKWDIRVTQIPCDGSNLLQVNIKIVFEDWIYSFKLTCPLSRLPQAVANTSQPGVATSQVWIGKMELTLSEYLCILWTHFIISQSKERQHCFLYQTGPWSLCHSIQPQRVRWHSTKRARIVVWPSNCWSILCSLQNGCREVYWEQAWLWARLFRPPCLPWRENW